MKVSSAAKLPTWDQDCSPTFPRLIEKSVIIHKDENGFGLRLKGQSPVFIEHVHENGAAWRAGIRALDMINKVNGIPVGQMDHKDVVLAFKTCSRLVALTLISPDQSPSHHGQPQKPKQFQKQQQQQKRQDLFETRPPLGPMMTGGGVIRRDQAMTSSIRQSPRLRAGALSRMSPSVSANSLPAAMAANDTQSNNNNSNADNKNNILADKPPQPPLASGNQLTAGKAATAASITAPVTPQLQKQQQQQQQQQVSLQTLMAGPKRPVIDKRTEIIREFIDTERAHTERLRCLNELFYRPLKQAGFMSVDQLRLVFSCHRTLYKIHRQIYRILMSANYDACPGPLIGSALLEIFEGDLKRRLERASSNFCSAQATNVELLNKMTRRDTKTGEFLAQVTSQQMVGRLGVKDLLASCFQRLTKYPLLLENLLKATPLELPDEEFGDDAADPTGGVGGPASAAVISGPARGSPWRTTKLRGRLDSPTTQSLRSSHHSHHSHHHDHHDHHHHHYHRHLHHNLNNHDHHHNQLLDQPKNRLAAAHHGRPSPPQLDSLSISGDRPRCAAPPGGYEEPTQRPRRRRCDEDVQRNNDGDNKAQDTEYDDDEEEEEEEERGEDYDDDDDNGAEDEENELEDDGQQHCDQEQHDENCQEQLRLARLGAAEAARRNSRRIMAISLAEEREFIERALLQSRQILVRVNDAIRVAIARNRLKEIWKRTDKYPDVPFSSIDISKQQVLHEGLLTLRLAKRSFDVYVLLLNDYIIILTREGQDKYRLKFFTPEGKSSAAAAAAAAAVAFQTSSAANSSSSLGTVRNILGANNSSNLGVSIVGISGSAGSNSGAGGGGGTAAAAASGATAQASAGSTVGNVANAQSVVGAGSNNLTAPHQAVYSPIFVIDEHLTTRDAATDENGFYLLCKRKDDSRIYEFASRSPAERLKWRDKIQTAIERQMSRNNRLSSCASTLTKSSSEISTTGVVHSTARRGTDTGLSDERNLMAAAMNPKSANPSGFNTSTSQQRSPNESSVKSRAPSGSSRPSTPSSEPTKIVGTISYVTDDGIVMPSNMESSRILVDQAIQVNILDGSTMRG